MGVCLPAGSPYYQGLPGHCLIPPQQAGGGHGRAVLTAPGESLAKPGKQQISKTILGCVCHPGQEGFLPACVQHPCHHIPEGGGEAHRSFHQGTGWDLRATGGGCQDPGPALTRSSPTARGEAAVQ